jgi:ABC-2 type transport system ATP-binding protein
MPDRQTLSGVRPTDATIVVRELTKRYGRHLAVDRLSFEVPAGVVAGFVGPNGAGKSTTLAMLVRLVRPTAGYAAVLGRDIASSPDYMRQVGALIETPAFYRSLTGRQNLALIAKTGQHDPRRVGSALDEVGLAERAADRYGTYSTGMKQRLGIAAALLSDPEVLLLDEPASGLDPVGIADMRKLLVAVGRQGRTVLVSSHALADLEQVCDWLVMIDRGACLYQGAADQLLAAGSTRVQAAPSAAKDLEPLRRVLTSTGHDVAISGDHVSVAVDGVDPKQVAVAISREAATAGIVLVRLETVAASLEDRYLEMVARHQDGGQP